MSTEKEVGIVGGLSGVGVSIRPSGSSVTHGNILCYELNKDKENEPCVEKGLG